MMKDVRGMLMCCGSEKLVLRSESANDGLPVVGDCTHELPWASEWNQMPSDDIQRHSVLHEKHHNPWPACPLLVSERMREAHVIADIISLSKRRDICNAFRFQHCVNFSFVHHSVHIRSPVVLQKNDLSPLNKMINGVSTSGTSRSGTMIIWNSQWTGFPSRKRFSTCWFCRRSSGEAGETEVSYPRWLWLRCT